MIDTVFWNTVGLGSWARATIALLSLADISSNRALLAAPQLTTTTSPLTVSGSPSRSNSTAFTVRPDSSVSTRSTRVFIVPIWRASINRVSPRRSRPRWVLSLVKNHRQTGIWVFRNSCPGSAPIISTTSPRTIASRICPSPLWLELIDPFASTTPASPPGRSFQSICCNHA